MLSRCQQLVTRAEINRFEPGSSRPISSRNMLAFFRAPAVDFLFDLRPRFYDVAVALCAAAYRRLLWRTARCLLRPRISPTLQTRKAPLGSQQLSNRRRPFASSASMSKRCVRIGRFRMAACAAASRRFVALRPCRCLDFATRRGRGVFSMLSRSASMQFR